MPPAVPTTSHQSDAKVLDDASDDESGSAPSIERVKRMLEDAVLSDKVGTAVVVHVNVS